MMQSRLNHQEKVANASSLLNLRLKIESVLFALLILFLPSQFGKHFWPDFSIVSGIRIDYLSPTLYFTDIIIGVLLLVWLPSKFKQPLWKTLNKGFLLVVLFLLINVLVSHNIFNGVVHLLKFLEFSFVAYYVASTIRTYGQFQRIGLSLGIGVIGESLLAIAQEIHHGSVGGLMYLVGERFFTAQTPGIANASINGVLYLRPYGTFSHPNVLAGFLLCSMIVLFLSGKTFVSQRVRISAVLLGSSALVLTLSRGAVMLWITLLAVFFLQTKRKMVASLVLLMVIGVLAFTSFGTRVLQTNLSEEAVIQRVDLMSASLTLVSQQPLIGIGLGNFLPMLERLQRPLSVGTYLQPVHNIFLLVLTETGIVGLGIFIWFLHKTYRRLFRQIKISRVPLPYRIFVIGVSVVLVLGSFDHYFLTLQQGQLLFTLLLGLSWTSLEE